MQSVRKGKYSEFWFIEKFEEDVPESEIEEIEAIAIEAIKEIEEKLQEIDRKLAAAKSAEVTK